MKLKNILSTLFMVGATTTMITAELANAQTHGRGITLSQSKEIILNMGGEVFGNRGGRENGTLYLKQEIYRQYPQLRLQNFDLEFVTVIGVSEALRSSNSTLTLMLNRHYQDQAVLEHRGRGHRGMDSATLVPRRRAQRLGEQTWQIDFSAATRVQRVIIQLEKEDQRGGHGRVHMQKVGEYKAVKAISLPQTVSVNKFVDTIEIKSSKRIVTIQSVEAVFQNGQRRLLDLRGTIAEGQKLKTALLRERQLSYLIVTAFSNDLIGASGKYEVLVGASGRR